MWQEVWPVAAVLSRRHENRGSLCSACSGCTAPESEGKVTPSLVIPEGTCLD